REAELHGGDERDARRLPRSPEDARGVHDAHRTSVRPARLAAHALALLGPVSGPVAIAAPASPQLAAAFGRAVRGARAGEAPAAALVAFLGAAADPGARQALLRSLQVRLPA